MYQLQQLADKLALVMPNNLQIKPISVDFTAKKLQHRCLLKNLKTETLIKALGKQNPKTLTIIDATAGFGNDAFILAAAGCKVLLIERSFIIFQLLADGFTRAKTCLTTQAIVNNMDLIAGDAITILAKLPIAQYPDIVYLDPMFPARRKSALVHKEMQALQTIIGHEQEDSVALFTNAIKVAKLRVIVKRPRLAPIISATSKPTFSLPGSTCRFDIYLTAK